MTPPLGRRLGLWLFCLLGWVAIPALAAWAIAHHRAEGLAAFADRAEIQMDLLASLVERTLRTGHYTDAVRFVDAWGANRDDIHRIRLVGGNGFELGRYEGGKGSPPTATLSRTLTYSYRGDATLTMDLDLSPVAGAHAAYARVVAIAGLAALAADTTLIALLWRSRRYAMTLAASHRALAEARDRYRSVVEGIKEVIFQADAQGRWTFLNPAWTEATGFPLDESLGRPALDFVHPDDRQGSPDLLVLLGRCGEDHCRCELRWLHRDAGFRWMEVFAERATDGTGAVVGASGTLSDVTERRGAEEALREADSRKDEFLATLAHELRNPLAPIENALAILKLKCPQDPTLVSARELIYRQLRHLVRLVDDLLDVGRISRGRLILRTERVALADIVAQALEAARPHAERAGHRLEVQLPERPVLLIADPVRLAQIFANLLNNACKYTPRAGQIRLTAARSGSAVEVAISDSGIGIAAEHLGSVFELFSQVHPSRDHPQGGLGIGLSLCRILAEMHGGRVEARSDGAGQGSTFVVRLPALPEAAETPAGRPVAAATLGGSQTRRILIADDNPDAAESLALLLRLAGHEVEIARDGLEAVAAADRCRPDVILLDLGMPRLDGCGACRQIRTWPWARQVPIVALTGWGQDQDRQRSCEAGFDRHLVKPVDPAELLRLLDEPSRPERAACAFEGPSGVDGAARRC